MEVSVGRRRVGLVGLAASVGAVLTQGGSSGGAYHWSANGWRHDHSSTAIFPRPDGFAAIQATFGNVTTGCRPTPCSCPAAADDARTWFPSAKARGVGDYVKYHSRLATNVGNNIRGHIGDGHQDGALDYGIYGYNCRYQTGSTTKPSLHAWGAAIDTNTARNPYGQSYWNGVGADGQDHGTYIPQVYKDHNFYWGLNFSTPDPQHFQYATGY
jgi:hypothetical protein